MSGEKRRRTAGEEWEGMVESGYQWPRPFRVSVYIYPVQMKMLEEIARVWKKKKRDVFFEAFQTYIGYYVEWKNERDAARKKARRRGKK